MGPVNGGHMGRRGFVRIGSATRAARMLQAAVFACALGLGLAPSAALAAPATTSVNSEAVILEPLTIQKDEDMDFGSIADLTGAGGNVVMVPTAPSASCTADPNLIRVGNCLPAEFSGQGSTDQVIRVNVPNTPIDLTNITSGNNETMPITVFDFDGDPNLQYVSGNIQANGVVRYKIVSGSGVYSFRLGGTLAVGAGQGELTGRHCRRAEIERRDPGHKADPKTGGREANSERERVTLFRNCIQSQLLIA